MANRSIKRTNPFQYGVVIDDSAFCNRTDEISFLKSQVLNGYSTWLYSPRRYGKTSLVDKVFRELDGVECIYIDLYNISSKDDFSRKYSKALAEKLFNWKDDIRKLTRTISDLFRKLSPVISFDGMGNPGFSMNVNTIDSQEDIETILDVPNVISLKSGKKICIAFDEFQEIKRIDPFLISWMRSAFQRHKYVSYIFLGSKQSLMKEIFASTHSPFYEFAAKMNLSEISWDDLFDFIKGNFKKYGLPIEDKTIEFILEKSECQPHYTQYFASVVFDLVKEGLNQDDKTFEAEWIKKVLLPQVDLFHDIFDQLTNHQRVTLRAIADLGTSGIYSQDAREKYKLPVSSTLNEALKALQKKSLVQKSGEIYKISNPIFREWLQGLE